MFVVQRSQQSVSKLGTQLLKWKRSFSCLPLGQYWIIRLDSLKFEPFALNLYLNTCLWICSSNTEPSYCPYCVSTDAVQVITQCGSDRRCSILLLFPWASHYLRLSFSFVLLLLTLPATYSMFPTKPLVYTTTHFVIFSKACVTWKHLPYEVKFSTVVQYFSVSTGVKTKWEGCRCTKGEKHPHDVI